MPYGLKRLQSAGHLLEANLEAYSQALLALVIDTRWSNATLNLILNEPDDTRRKDLINTWVNHRFADLERINLTAVLVAGVISSAFSWYNITDSPWGTRALWYCGLLFAMAAITTAGVHSAGLHRLGCHPDWHEKLQETLGTPINGNLSRWRPRPLQPVIWQTPGFMLKLSITCFLVGLIILVWVAAEQAQVIWTNDDAKIAVLFTVAVATSLILYAMSVFGLFFKTVA